MMENNYASIQEKPAKNGSVIGGIIGAILGAIVGAVIWVCYSLATAEISTAIGFLLGLLTGLGYDLLKGRQGALRIVTMLVCIVLAVVGAEIAYYSITIHNWYVEESELLANGTDDEIARYYNDDEGYADYQAASSLAKRLYIEELRSTFETSEEEYVRFMVSLDEFKSSLLSDIVQSLLFALIGSALLILAGGKKAKSTPTVTFNEEALTVTEEASEAADVAAEESDKTEIQA